MGQFSDLERTHGPQREVGALIGLVPERRWQRLNSKFTFLFTFAVERHVAVVGRRSESEIEKELDQRFEAQVLEIVSKQDVDDQYLKKYDQHVQNFDGQIDSAEFLFLKHQT